MAPARGRVALPRGGCDRYCRDTALILSAALAGRAAPRALCAGAADEAGDRASGGLDEEDQSPRVGSCGPHARAVATRCSRRATMQPRSRRIAAPLAARNTPRNMAR